ncbi:hypothetical protein BWI17_03810 [Betaproteobacteria bacterium GR16-43]|nr:hypothetical protein BWI17_03810 [Betaproteobacteria bacterium GR16-43]
MNDRAKSWLYTLLFWSGIAGLCIGGALFGSAGNIVEYFVAFGALVATAGIWSLAYKLNPEDVDQFFQHTSGKPFRGNEATDSRGKKA